MNYTKTVEKFGRLEEVFDMARFAADLAAELKGKVINPSAAPLDSDRDALEVDGVRLWLTVKSWGAGANSKVNVRACAPYFEGKYHDHPHGPDYKMPDAYVSASRPMAAIAKDVRRRVIEPAAAPIAKWLEHADMIAKRGGNLVEVAARLRTMGLEVRLDEGATRTGTFYKYADGSNSVSGEFYPDGAVSIRHLNLKLDMLESLVAAMRGDRV